LFNLLFGFSLTLGYIKRLSKTENKRYTSQQTQPPEVVGADKEQYQSLDDNPMHEIVELLPSTEKNTSPNEDLRSIGIVG
jgi:hypothetical protein